MFIILITFALGVTSTTSVNYLDVMNNPIVPATLFKTAKNSTINYGNCVGDDFIDCYEDILEYVQLGDETMQISDEKKAIIVIGLTRVGKTIFTQFAANQSNPLLVACMGSHCTIIDDSGDRGDPFASRALVPNTVEDTITNGIVTPFYDMPGFDDTRNMSVEIANLFLIQKLVTNIEELKIVVVARHDHLHSASIVFISLMKFLIKFISKPAKFKDSIVLISTMAGYNEEDSALFADITTYLELYKEALHGNDPLHPTPEENAIAESWIDCFLEGSPENLQNVAIFREPGSILNGTSLREDATFNRDLSKMKNLIWNETVFTPLLHAEVGFTLSTEAELFLEKATTNSSAAIRSKLISFVSSAKLFMQELIQSVAAEPNDEGMAKLMNHLNQLQNIEFEYCNSDPSSSPRSCINQINSTLSTLVAEMNHPIFAEIEEKVNFLQFSFENSRMYKQYDMTEWITEFSTIWPHLVKFLISLINCCGSLQSNCFLGIAF